MTTKRNSKSGQTTKRRRPRGSMGEISASIGEQHARRCLDGEADRWVEESQGHQASVAEADKRQTSRQKRRALRRFGSKLEARQLRLLERDDELIREVLCRKGRLGGIVAADQPSDADEMLWFIDRELKLLPAFEALALSLTYVDEQTGKEIQRRTTYSPLLLSLLSVLSRYLGLASGPTIQSALLCDLRWMALLGFNAAEVDKGACRRSESLIGKTREGGGGRFVQADEMGPVICSDCCLVSCGIMWVYLHNYRHNITTK